MQDEGSQLLAYLLAPRRGEMVADYCAGAGGKTLALAMLMRGTGRIYAMDVSAKRLAELAPRAARAGVTSVHPLVLSGEGDARAKRLAGKIDRVLVDAPCSGFGTLRRNPDLKWRHGPQAIGGTGGQAGAHPGGGCAPGEARRAPGLCDLQHPARGERSHRRCVRRGARGVRAALLQRAADRAAHRSWTAGERLRLWPHRHGCDGFFAAAFERR